MSTDRRPALADLPRRFDLVVIGGGITGAGIFNEAARTGASVLLVERNDFASGTSSGSSKLVHGGLRYLKSGQWRLTLESVRERNRLLRERAGLIEPQPFLMPIYRGMKPGRGLMRAGLAVYDLMGGQRTSRSLSAAEALALEPDIRSEDLLGAVLYDDARTDDAGLTLRVIFEARAEHAIALNHVGVAAVGRSADGRVRTVSLHDRVRDEHREIEAGLVITATGARSLPLLGEPAGAPPLRPLRGSHLIFPAELLPVRRAVSWLHPQDRRPIFAYPWEGAVLLGTTDLDHDEADGEPRMSGAELDYLVAGLAHQFPARAIRGSDAISSFAGVRPIVAGGKADPSAESRESATWSSPGWIGITGGKLTTFRVAARTLLHEAAKQVPLLAPAPASPVSTDGGTRLAARYGKDFEFWLAAATAADHETIAGSPYVWGELRWALRHEAVVHLDDLLLRRTRLGLLAAQGGAAHLERVGAICRVELGWDESRWQQERSRYLDRWQRQHAVVAT
ncbi:MAG: glycerol-3-phosphate dehydrogenase/oxidase [Nevskia sp.]